MYTDCIFSIQHIIRNDNTTTTHITQTSQMLHTTLYTYTGNYLYSTTTNIKRHKTDWTRHKTFETLSQSLYQWKSEDEQIKLLRSTLQDTN